MNTDNNDNSNKIYLIHSGTEDIKELVNKLKLERGIKDSDLIIITPEEAKELAKGKTPFIDQLPEKTFEYKNYRLPETKMFPAKTGKEQRRERRQIERLNRKKKK